MNQKLDFSGDLTKEHIREMELFNKFEEKDLENHYDRVSINYEEIYLRAGYPDPKKCQEAVSRLCEENKIKKSDAQVIDFGCGTGLVGQYLSDDGFYNIVGLDASNGMLNEAENKKVYS